MTSSITDAPDRAWRRGGALVFVLALSAAWESLFLFRGLNPVDEGWPLYAAMQLHAGGTLYRDVFFVFPPGHVLSAWIGFALDPPGLVGARVLYAAFNVALCGALYLLARRLMPPGWAFFGACLLAVAAPNSHVQQLLFGYRYLVFPVLALLTFSERLRTGDGRWMVLAGVLVGVATCFRIDSGAAAAAGLGLGVLASGPSWNARSRDAAALAAGACLALAPVLAWLFASVGPETVWREVVVRPVAMTALQEKPIPPLSWPTPWHVAYVVQAFVALLFRVGLLLYAGYAVALGISWVRELRGGRRGPAPLLLATVGFGGIFFVRSLGRSDEPHLMSAIPPLCLLLGHLFASSFATFRWAGSPRGRATQVAWAIAFLGVWTYGAGSQRIFSAAWRGAEPVRALHGRVVVRPGQLWLDPTIEAIVAATGPDERILVLGPESLFYVLSGRRGPGHADVIMPGTFLAESEELAFLARLEQAPPALIVVPRLPFDLMASRAVSVQAPAITRWIRRRYVEHVTGERYVLLRWDANP